MASEFLTSHFKVTKSREDKAKTKPGSQSSNLLDDSAGPSKQLSDFDLLRQFDMEWRFGPSIGLSRLERWERAEKHGLNPPEGIRKLIQEHNEDEAYTECVWNDYNI